MLQFKYTLYYAIPDKITHTHLRLCKHFDSIFEVTNFIATFRGAISHDWRIVQHFDYLTDSESEYLSINKHSAYEQELPF